jgi:hypothetical protein
MKSQYLILSNINFFWLFLSAYVLVFIDLRSEVVVRVADIGGIIEHHHSLNFNFKTYVILVVWSSITCISKWELWFVLSSEWASDCCLTPTQQQVNFQWDEIGFVLDQYT